MKHVKHYNTEIGFRGVIEGLTGVFRHRTRYFRGGSLKYWRKGGIARSFNKTNQARDGDGNQEGRNHDKKSRIKEVSQALQRHGTTWCWRALRCDKVAELELLFEGGREAKKEDHKRDQGDF